jgi:hypothetical protein
MIDFKKYSGENKYFMYGGQVWERKPLVAPDFKNSIFFWPFKFSDKDLTEENELKITMLKSRPKKNHEECFVDSFDLQTQEEVLKNGFNK